MTEDAVRIIPLGGLGEVGKNMTAIEYRGKIVVLDCGVEFPSDEMLGIDLVLPDIRWLVERRDDVLAFIITHGHEDHQGALPFVLEADQQARVREPLHLGADQVEAGRARPAQVRRPRRGQRPLTSGHRSLRRLVRRHEPQRAGFAVHRAGDRPRRRGADGRLPVRPHADRRPDHRRERVRTPW